MKHVLILAFLWLTGHHVLAQTSAETPVGFTYTIDSGMQGRQVYGSTQQPFSASGELVGGNDLSAQTKQVFENLKTALGTLGMDFSYVHQVTYHLKGSFGQPSEDVVAKVNAIAGAYFSGGSRITDFKQLPKIARDEVLIEIEVIAIR